MKIYKEVLESLINETVFLDKKCFGYLIASQNIVDDYYIFREDARQTSLAKQHFEKIGHYYKDNQDAGFLATPEEEFLFDQMCTKTKKKVLAMFHVHRRHPDVFTYADWEMHPSSKICHLIISLRNKNQPKIRLFKINKETEDTDKMFYPANLETVNSFSDGIDIKKIEPFFLNDFNKKLIVNQLKKLTPEEVCKFWKNYRSSSRKKLQNELDFNKEGIQKKLVTNHDYKQFLPLYSSDDYYPLTNVDYYDAFLFSSWLGMHLLSGVEWEKNRDSHVTGDIFEHEKPELERYAFYSQNSSGLIHPVAQLKSNKFGLYDIEGNVWEWCECQGSNGITKGGSFRAFPEMMLPGYTLDEKLTARYSDLGFRMKK